MDTADIIETFSRGQLPIGKDLRDGQSQRRLLSDHQDRHRVSEKEIQRAGGKRRIVCLF